ncbi:MAG: hypothetical protein IJE09_03635 [Oscillospiraceae bacterium]|nr:hypothetical protein [Oscillospiraceae bacterium]
MKKRIILALLLTFCMLLSACGNDSSPAKESEATAEPAEIEELEENETVEEAFDYAALAKDEIAMGKYHDAMSTLILWEATGLSDEDVELFDELYDEIVYKCSDNEPKTGTELERTFKYQGGGLLVANAESGPLEITVRDIEDEGQYVRFYVRQGETAEINIPAAEYEISFKIGLVWFDDNIGFGDVCYADSYDETFDFASSSDNAWITNTRWEITL